MTAYPIQYIAQEKKKANGETKPIIQQCDDVFDYNQDRGTHASFAVLFWQLWRHLVNQLDEGISGKDEGRKKIFVGALYRPT